MGFFVYLGVKNAWRNIGRSVFAVLSVAIAASVLTYSISLGRGHATGLHASIRAMTGGEITVYSTLFDAGGTDAAQSMQYRILPESPLTDLNIFHPSILEQGFLVPASGEYSDWFGDDFATSLASRHEIRAISPRYQRPVLRLDITANAEGEEVQSQTEVKLMGRDIDIDNAQYHPLQENIKDGRWFQHEDSLRSVCIVLENQQSSGGHGHAPRVGDTLHIRIPRAEATAVNGLGFDYSAYVDVELEIIGLLSLVSQTIEWGGGADMQREDLYWTFDDILIPLGLWEMLWDSTSDVDYRPQQMGLLLSEVSTAADTLASLRTCYPQYTFYNVAEQAQNLMQTMSHQTPPRTAPRDAYVIADYSRSGDIQEDLRIPIVLGLTGTAALVIAANLLIMASERRREIAVLKSVGAQRLHIMVMVVSEASFLSFAGGTLGFAFMQVPVVLNHIVASLSASTILLGLVGNMLTVLGISIAMAMVFSLIPAQRMINLPVMEVLRHE